MNLPKLSADLNALFPHGVAAAELRGAGDASLLLPGEAEGLGRAIQTRIQEFAAGRSCARLALAQFGMHDVSLPMRSDRQPAWPPPMVGSITHTSGFCAAVAGEGARFMGLGLDCEVVGRVQEELWRKICLPRETAWLRSLPAAQQPAAAALIFAAKEAFYKSQYPATHEFLNFHDVWIDVPELGPANAGFAVHAARELILASSACFPVLGQYRLHEQYVSAGVALDSPQ